MLDYFVHDWNILYQCTTICAPASCNSQTPVQRESRSLQRYILLSFYCTTSIIPSLFIPHNVTHYMLYVWAASTWRVISPLCYIIVVFRLSSSWTRTTRRLGTGAARPVSNWRTLTKPRKVSWKLKKCPEVKIKMWRSGSVSVTWSWRNLRTRRSGCTRKCSRAKKWLKVNW